MTDPTLIDYQTEPSQYRHITLQIEGQLFVDSRQTNHYKIQN